MKPHIEKRWALEWQIWGSEWSLLGRYCFPGGGAYDHQIKTFTTRRLARIARSTCSYPAARPARVVVTVQVERAP